MIYLTSGILFSKLKKDNLDLYRFISVVELHLGIIAKFNRYKQHERILNRQFRHVRRVVDKVRMHNYEGVFNFYKKPYDKELAEWLQKRKIGRELLVLYDAYLTLFEK